MKTENLESGYIVATDEYTICIYNTFKEAEEHINYQRKIGSTENWYIVEFNYQTGKLLKHELR